MFETLAKTAAIGSLLSFARRVSGRSQPDYLGAIGLIGLGVVIGASTGLLLAPRTGRELREDISRRARTLTSRAQERMNHMRERAPEALENI